MSDSPTKDMGHCLHCGHENLSMARFCQHCGVRLICESESVNLEAERRPATILFADISGFASISEQSDPEIVRELLNACFENLVPVVTSHGGVIDKYIGDEIMAIFGGSRAVENDAELAVRSALIMLENMKAFNNAHSLDWQLHIGINSGLVITGAVGTQSQRDYSVIGDTVNVAARLAQKACRGEILVGERTYRHSWSMFSYQIVGHECLKGKSRTVRVYRLLGESKDRRYRKRWTLAAPLVGRQELMSELQQVLHELMGGKGSIVFISGEAGVGKSRIVAELQQTEVGMDLEWFEGKCQPVFSSASYWPFVEILKKLLDAERDVNVEDITAIITDLLPEQQEQIVSVIAHLLSIKTDSTTARSTFTLNAEDLKIHIYRSIYRLIAAFTSKRPLILIFEDLHWADQSSLDLLLHIAGIVQSHPLVLLLVYRKDDAPGLSQLRHKLKARYDALCRNVDVEPLSIEETVKICLHSLPNYDSETLQGICKILNRVEGNPYFAEEMINALKELNILYQNDQGQWKIDRHREVTVPESLRGILLGRIDRMNEDLRQTVKYASVIGRIFLFKILEKMMNDSEKLEDNIAKLQNIEVIRERFQTADREYIFKHELFHHVTYESILNRQRKELHGQVANIIERLFEERIEEFCDLLAYHYSQAQCWEKAHAYLTKAGDRALTIAADAEALALLKKTFAACQKAFGDQLNHLDKAVLERKMGEALFRRGDHASAEEHLHRALWYLGEPFPKTRLRGRILMILTLLRQIQQNIMGAKVNPSQATESMHEILKIREILGFIYYFTNREYLLTNIISTINYAERYEFLSGMIKSYASLVLVLDNIGKFNYAHIYIKKIENLLYFRKNEEDLAYANHIKGYHYDCLCIWNKSYSFLEKAIKTYLQKNSIKLWAAANTTRLLIDFHIGKKNDFLKDIIRDTNEMKKVGIESGDNQILSWSLNVKGLYYLYLDSWQEAYIHLKKALDILIEVPDYYIYLHSSALLSEALIQQMQLGHAHSSLKKSKDIIRKYNLVGPFVCGILVKEARLVSLQFKQTHSEKDHRKAKRACAIALKKAKTFRNYYPEALVAKASLDYLSGGSKYRSLFQESLNFSESFGSNLHSRFVKREMKNLLGE